VTTASGIRAITLDLDDTLWPVGPAIEKAEHLSYQWLNTHAKSIVDLWPMERLREERMRIYKARPDLRHDLLLIRRMALQAAFAQLDCAEEDKAQLIDQSLQVFMTGRNQVQLYPEVLASLERLSTRYRLASLSNGNANVERIGLGHLFYATVAAHEHGMSKPDPRLFHIACKALDCQPEEVLHVGDDALLDVEAAQAAGLKSAWMNRQGLSWSGQGAVVSVSDMNELERWLERNDKH
jgi:putative hydrolase of the HAD superfamily